jgi:RNA polymerase sigma-70 factor (sigma-E family)
VSVGGDHGLADSRVRGAGAVPRVEPRRPADRPAARTEGGRGSGARSNDAWQEPLVVSEPAAVPRARPSARSGGSALTGTTGLRNGKRTAADEPPVAPAAGASADGADAADLPGPDDGGFREYVATRSRALLRTAYLLTGNKADAEDLVQAALAKTYLAWDRIEDRGALDGYVRRAIVNTHISWWRRRRVEEYPTDEIPDQAVADHAIASDLQECMRRAIDRLPDRMRTAVVLRYYEDMTEAEVAEILGVSLGTVKSTVSRAVAKLRSDADLQ